MTNNSNGILVVIAIALIGIFAVLVVDYNKKQSATPAERIVNSIGETVEEIGDEIDDSTSN